MNLAERSSFTYLNVKHNGLLLTLSIFLVVTTFTHVRILHTMVGRLSSLPNLLSLFLLSWRQLYKYTYKYISVNSCQHGSSCGNSGPSIHLIMHGHTLGQNINFSFGFNPNQFKSKNESKEKTKMPLKCT